MTLVIPKPLEHYEPIIQWIQKTYHRHPLESDAVIDHQLHYLFTLYNDACDHKQFINDIVAIEAIWHIHTLALSHHQPPEYWDPLHEHFETFLSRHDGDPLRLLIYPNPCIEPKHLIQHLYSLCA